MAGPAIAGWIALGAAGRAAVKRYGALIARKMFPKLFKKKVSKPDEKLLKKLNAQKDKALKDKKLADKTDKIVEKKEKKLLKQEKKADKPAVKSAKKFRKDTKGQREGKKYNPDPRTDSMNYSDKEAREFGEDMLSSPFQKGSAPGWTKKDALLASLHHDKALMNVPVAATAVAGTTASLISKRKNKNKNKNKQ